MSWKCGCLLLLVVGMYTACGGPLTPDEACRENAKVVCAKLLECTPEAGRQAVPWLKDQASCEAQFGGDKCTGSQACNGDLSLYDGGKARECINGVAGLSCDKATGTDVTTHVPACKQICKTS